MNTSINSSSKIYSEFFRSLLTRDLTMYWVHSCETYLDVTFSRSHGHVPLSYYRSAIKIGLTSCLVKVHLADERMSEHDTSPHRSCTSGTQSADSSSYPPRCWAVRGASGCSSGGRGGPDYSTWTSSHGQGRSHLSTVRSRRQVSWLKNYSFTWQFTIYRLTYPLMLAIS